VHSNTQAVEAYMGYGTLVIISSPKT